MIQSSPYPARTVRPPAAPSPAPPPLTITCPSCGTALAVDSSVGLEGPCPICTFYLRVAAPALRASAPLFDTVPPTAAPAKAAPIAAPAPIKPEPRQVPGGSPRPGIPTAREPIIERPRHHEAPRPRGTFAKCRAVWDRSRGLFRSPASRIIGGVFAIIVFLGTISGFIYWDQFRTANELEKIYPPSKGGETPKPEFNPEPDQAQLVIPGPILIHDR